MRWTSSRLRMTGSLCSRGGRTMVSVGRSWWSVCSYKNRALHFGLDDTLKEDSCRLKGQPAQALAVINNLVSGLSRGTRFETLPDARRYYEANLPAAYLGYALPGLALQWP
jgi:hypothetical protein